MKKFTTLTGIAAPIPIINIYTDMIYPAEFMKTIHRSGLGKYLFYKFRYDKQGDENPNFILNTEPYNKAVIIIAGDNFGCGSSREHAPWTLLDFGIRCVIAPSFADIFYNNSAKNGLLLIKLPQEKVDLLMEEAKNQALLTIDLPQQKISSTTGITIEFAIEAERKYRLLNGLDDIDFTLQEDALIAKFEQKQAVQQPWL